MICQVYEKSTSFAFGRKVFTWFRLLMVGHIHPMRRPLLVSIDSMLRMVLVVAVVDSKLTFL